MESQRKRHLMSGSKVLNKNVIVTFVAYASISEVLGRCLHNSYVLARRAGVFDSKEQKDKNFYLAFPNLEILQIKLKLL